MIRAVSNIISEFALILLLACLLYIVGCDTAKKENTEAYIAEIEHWQQLRIDSLKGVTGYLNLAGLFWLEEGENTIGSDSTNRFIFPTKAAGKLGTLIKNGDSVWLVERHPDLIINAEGDSVLVYAPNNKAFGMRFGNLNWYIIQRGTDLGIRLKDYDHPLLGTFQGIENYPIDINWRVMATFEKYPEPKIVEIKNQVGMTLKQEVYGQFRFNLLGQEYTLEPVSPLENDTYFTMIYDQTSGDATYGSGRYIDVPRPDEDGITYIDFNKAYNPPCAWTEYATCTFPHAANRLPLRIEAGEKYMGHH
jgi:uncharacterized protein (DUF1684 family)